MHVKDANCDSIDITEQEALMYRQGLKVELKEKPGSFDRIASYDPMMVPPIWLEKDPQPRYPHEIRIITKNTKKLCFSKSLKKLGTCSQYSLVI